MPRTAVRVRGGEGIHNETCGGMWGLADDVADHVADDLGDVAPPLLRSLYTHHPNTTKPAFSRLESRSHDPQATLRAPLP